MTRACWLLDRRATQWRCCTASPSSAAAATAAGRAALLRESRPRQRRYLPGLGRTASRLSLYRMCVSRTMKVYPRLYCATCTLSKSKRACLLRKAANSHCSISAEFLRLFGACVSITCTHSWHGRPLVVLREGAASGRANGMAALGSVQSFPVQCRRPPPHGAASSIILSRVNAMLAAPPLGACSQADLELIPCAIVDKGILKPQARCYGRGLELPLSLTMQR